MNPSERVPIRPAPRWTPTTSRESSMPNRYFRSTNMQFFFSSRRRHTMLQGDWSSDVCSSDLGAAPGYLLTNCMVRGQSLQDGRVCSLLRGHPDPSPPFRLLGVVPPVCGEKT